MDTKLGRVVRLNFSIDVRASGATPIAAVDSAAVASGPAIIRMEKSVFSGNEARVAAPNLVNADCTSGRVPDVRIAGAPKNGEYRLEEVEIPIDRAAGNHRASCNGKPVKAVSVFYKSKPGYTGDDDILIDADFRTGQVQRYRIEIVVR